ncbi:hypothetical protein JNUCC0626_10715 [Lentzea sp. JNUCC 0626]|uniref:hypothetical protein n=1 Tax=Lentzea sp. JNUCC 0626 TaxID=3367513 RepID=UPI0037497CB1
MRFRCESELAWEEREVDRPILASLLQWLAWVADAAAYEYKEQDDDVDACRAIRPELHAAAAQLLDDEDPDVRREASQAVAWLIEAPELAEHRPDVARRLVESTVDVESEEWAKAAVRVGNWGVRAFLDDEHPAVRACAASLPAYDGDPAAMEEVLAALRALAKVTAMYPTPFPDSVRGATGQDSDDWGRFLVKAFPEGFPAEPTENQQRVLTALLETDRCWNPMADGDKWLQLAGLPVRRSELRALTS